MFARIKVEPSQETAMLNYLRANGDGEYVVTVNGGRPVKVVKVPKSSNIQDLIAAQAQPDGDDPAVSVASEEQAEAPTAGGKRKR